ncbi:YncE family protein [Paenibacillus sp. FSL R7-0302]|uniref:YncE family protein n=1 Tax=Paenibacillus sp. FSL R7-0302 TaxID=2921681 RepID=UPI0030FC60FD
MNTEIANHRRNLASNFNPYVFASYELSYYFGYVAVIDPVYNKVTKRIPVGLNPGPMCLNPSEDKLYVVNTGNDSVTIIDAYNFNVIKTLHIGSSSTSSAPVAIFAAANVNKVYVAHSGNRAVTIIDSVTDTVIKQVDLPSGSGYPFAFAGKVNSLFVFVACKSKDNDKGNVVAISVDDDTAHPVGDDTPLEFDGTHNPLTVYPGGVELVTLGPTGMLTHFEQLTMGPSKTSSMLDNTVSGIYLDNKMLFCTSREDRAYLKKFNNLFMDQQGNITHDQFTEIPSYKGQDKIRVSSDQSTICITIQPTTFPTGGLQIYDVNAASSKFVPLPYVGDLALYDDIIAYVGQLTSIQPIALGNPSNPIPAIPIGTSLSDRVNVKNIISGYSNQSL